jgi:hypothetical protein
VDLQAFLILFTDDEMGRVNQKNVVCEDGTGKGKGRVDSKASSENKEKNWNCHF